MAETKYCRDCGSEIESTVVKCPNCGSRQAGAVSYQEIETTFRQTNYPMKNPGLAAVLSAFFVGFGQIYNGEIAKGLLLIVVYLISILMIFVLIGLITTPLVWIFGIYDAYNTAKRINAGEIVV
jgi:TM2 domain-containing membrane protein YozV